MMMKGKKILEVERKDTVLKSTHCASCLFVCYVLCTWFFFVDFATHGWWVHLIEIWNLTCALLGYAFVAFCLPFICIASYQSHLLFFYLSQSFFNFFFIFIKSCHMWHVLIWCIIEKIMLQRPFDHITGLVRDKDISSMTCLTLSPLPLNL